MAHFNEWLELLGNTGLFETPLGTTFEQSRL